MHLNMSYTEVRNLPTRYRHWFLKRLTKHFDRKNEMYEKGNPSGNKDSDFSSLNKFEESMDKKFSS